MSAPSPILRYFDYEHLPPHLQEISRPFAEVAGEMANRSFQDEAEYEAGLRKLLEAKDCFVRAMLPDRPTPRDPFIVEHR